MSEENWQDSLPEALRDAPYLAKAESVEDAVGKLNHAAKLVGTSIRIPAGDAPQDEQDAFYAKLTDVDGVMRMPAHDDADGLKALYGKLGMPESATGYKLPELDDFVWDESMGEDLRKYAHEAGLTPEQFKVFASNIAGQESAAGTESTKEQERIRAELRLDWGETLEDREALIRGWMDTSAAPAALREQFESHNLPIDTMNWLHNTAKQFKGDVAPISKDGTLNGQPGMSPTEAREIIPRLISDMTDMRETDPRYSDMQAKLVQAHRFANPG